MELSIDFFVILCYIDIIVFLPPEKPNIETQIGDEKTSAAITLGILCPTLGTILTSVIESVLKIENGKISRFWIWSCFAQLTGDTISNDTLYFSMLLSVIWMAVFLTAGLIHFKRTDV